MAIEMGAKAGIVPPDAKTIEYLKGRAVGAYKPVYATKDAAYCDEYHFDADYLAAGRLPARTSITSVTSTRWKNMAVDQVLIGSCTNGRL